MTKMKDYIPPTHPKQSRGWCTRGKDAPSHGPGRSAGADTASQAGVRSCKILHQSLAFDGMVAILRKGEFAERSWVT